MQKNLLTRLSFLAAAAALTACGGGGGDDPVPGAPQSVALEFMAVAGNTPVQCGSVVPGLGSGAVDAQIRDLRFYISEVALLRADGSEKVTEQVRVTAKGLTRLAALVKPPLHCPGPGTGSLP